MNIYLDTTLEHAGVKGMKWGRRKAKNKQAKQNKIGAYETFDYNRQRILFKKDHETAARKAKRNNKLNNRVTAAAAAGLAAAGGVMAYQYKKNGRHPLNYSNPYKSPAGAAIMAGGLLGAQAYGQLYTRQYKKNAAYDPVDGHYRLGNSRRKR